MSSLEGFGELRVHLDLTQRIHEVTTAQLQLRPAAVERLYALDGGVAIAPDRSMYSPGVGAGEPTLSCNAYLIRRHDGWTLWDTGIDDALAGRSEGKIIAHGIRGIVTRTITAQLQEIGLRAADIETVILSHAHFDHIGNCRLFQHAAWYLQGAEREAMFGPDYQRYGYLPTLYETITGARLINVSGDHDVFGDGSVRMISTPGHTPGHSCLLVRLPKTGPIVLSGDVAHFQYTFEHRCVPDMNSDARLTKESMDRVDAIVQTEGAKLWLNHDFAQSATLPHAPQWLE